MGWQRTAASMVFLVVEPRSVVSMVCLGGVSCLRVVKGGMTVVQGVATWVIVRDQMRGRKFQVVGCGAR